MGVVEKDILNRYTDLCIRKKDRGKEIRYRFEIKSVGSSGPEFHRSDVSLEDEKTMEQMLKLYMEKKLLLDELVKAVKGYIDQGVLNAQIMKDILSTFESFSGER